MRKIFTPAALALLCASTAVAAPTEDFTPKTLSMFYQEIFDQNLQKNVPQVMIQVQYDEDVYWVSGVSGRCSVANASGEKVDWTPDFSGPMSDYTLFYMGINGLSQYVDMDYTLEVPAGVFGNLEWESSNGESGRCNPALTYKFNVWELAGKPIEDFTTYSFEPALQGMTVDRVFKEFVVDLLFNAPVSFNSEEIPHRSSIRDSEGGQLNSAAIYWVPDVDNAALLHVKVRNIDLNATTPYTLYIGRGCLGDAEWADGKFAAGRANPELVYSLNPSAPELPEFDFSPELESTIFQQLVVEDALVPQTRMDVKFPDEVWWVSGVSRFCTVTDSEGNAVEWTPDFGGLSSDYSVFYFGVNGLSQYEDMTYTLRVPAGVFGDTAWNDDHQKGHANPELTYTFNVWELAGKPIEDKTVYDLEPETRAVSIQSQDVLFTLTFDEDMAVSSKLEDMWSVRTLGIGEEGRDTFVENVTLTASVSEENPKEVLVYVRGLDLSFTGEYMLEFSKGAFGNAEWLAADGYAGRACPMLQLTAANLAGVERVMSDASTDDTVYNLQGIRVDAERLPAGIYIRGGKKFVVK